MSWLVFLASVSLGVAPGQTQTASADIVSRLVKEVESGNEAAVKASLATDVLITNYSDGRSAELSDFLTYASGCKLRSLKEINQRFVVSWACQRPVESRVTSFWVSGDKISAIGFGIPVIIAPVAEERG